MLWQTKNTATARYHGTHAYLSSYSTVGLLVTSKGKASNSSASSAVSCDPAKVGQC